MTTIIDTKDIKPFDLIRPVVEPFRHGGHDAKLVVQKVELLHRPSPKPKPYDGLLTGKKVKATPWKTGTKLMIVLDLVDQGYSKVGWIYTLQADGSWRRKGDGRFYFDSVQDDELFILLERPEEPADSQE